MKRDQIIAMNEFVRSQVGSPIELGALRLPDSKTSWFEDARTAVRHGRRAVLSGHLNRLEEIVGRLNEIRRECPEAEFALLMHASQALELSSESQFKAVFEYCYVATDENIEATQIRQISTAWNPRWVLIPNRELNSADWISKFLLPSHQGRLYLFAPVPKDDDLVRSRIEPDELRLQIEEFRLEHPLIEILPPPPEWFVPAELGPWNLASRAASQADVVEDSRLKNEYLLSVVVPFRWTGLASESAMLTRCLKSVADCFASHESCEVIVVVDRDENGPRLKAGDLGLDLSDTVFIDVRRESTTSPDSQDWRAGFVRNQGAMFRRNRNGTLLFVDADVEIVQQEGPQPYDLQPSCDLLQLSEAPDAAPFTEASSSFLIVRCAIFFSVGGFSEAFSKYGCEDNDFVWKATQIGARVQTLPNATIRHLRPRHEDDDLVAKMLRLGPSADLMYRMTLDPAVHRHFFSALGSHLWFRAALKRFAMNRFLRALLAPIVFVLTLLEAGDRRKYLRGFWDVAVWKLKRPALWVRSNVWRAETVSHAWREHAWRAPNFFATTFGVLRVNLEHNVIRLKASRFGLNVISWRITLATTIVIDQFRWRLKVAQIRVAGACLWLLTALVSLFSNASWVVRVSAQRAWGGLRWLAGQIHAVSSRSQGALRRKIATLHRYRGTFERIKGESRREFSKLHRYKGTLERIRGRSNRIFGAIKKVVVEKLIVPSIYIANRPKAFWHLHAWRLQKIAGHLRSERWLLSEPTAWFKLRTPQFYRWVWRPVLKLRYILEYHLFTRWRKT